MDVSTRRASPPDFPQVLELIREFSVFQQTPDKVFITLEQMLKDAGRFNCFIAVEGEQICGFASFFFAYYSWSGKAIYLDDLYVRPAFRKSGIGKLLLNAVIELAKAEQCVRVRWQVSKWNSHAIAFYQGIGATIDETEINCDLVL